MLSLLLRKQRRGRAACCSRYCSRFVLFQPSHQYGLHRSHLSLTSHLLPNKNLHANGNSEAEAEVVAVVVEAEVEAVHAKTGQRIVYATQQWQVVER